MQSPEEVRAAYDAVAAEYAARFSDELTHKPFDRKLLARFATAVRSGGAVYDLGCGPGHTTAHLHACGATVRGLDLSAGLVREASRLHPELSFVQGDMLALPLPDGGAAGVVAFYSIVHFTPAQLRVALREMHRVLEPAGLLLLAFHIGDQVVRVEAFMGKAIPLDFQFFRPAAVVGLLEETGFVEVEPAQRAPYPNVEYPSRRAYVMARRG